MEEFKSTRDIVTEMTGKVLGGAKTPHSCSFPVLRKVDGKYVIAIYTQLFNREQVQQGLMQRPAAWCLADIADGSGFTEYKCREVEFCTAPYDRLYKKGTAAVTGTKEDIDDLYARLDEIRKRYITTGILDAFSYREFLTKLLSIVPSGQINFYRELSKLK